MLLIFLSFATGVMAGNGDDLIRQQLREMYGLDSVEYEIEILANGIESEDIAEGELTVKAMLRKTPLGLFTLQATVTREGKVVETAQVRTKIRKFAEVVVVTDRIKRWEKFTDDRMEIRRAEITNLREQSIRSFAELDGLRARRNISKDAILTLASTEPIPVIERGTETLIVYNDGLCRITVPGIALEAGMIGDQIRVKNKATKKIITARVIDDSAVAVDP